MKIFYAVQATGNGHLSRASQLYPYLKKLGEVDFFVSGNNSNVDFSFPAKYRSKGMSLHYSECGGLNYLEILKSIRPMRMIQEAKDLPLKDYDVILNDFESITALACKMQGRSSVQFGHQASFQSDKVPRPDKVNSLGEFILKNYARASQYVGLHFQPYDAFIYPPIIKDELMNQEVVNHNHITVYLPAFQVQCLKKAFEQLPDLHFHWFLDSVKDAYTEKNITYFPIYQKLFNESLRTCHGIITGGGFETPSEALFLGKEIMSIPIKNHYEQQCNASALKKMGVYVLDEVDEKFEEKIMHWYNNPTKDIQLKANNIQETLQYIVDTYSYKHAIQAEEEFNFI